MTPAIHLRLDPDLRAAVEAVAVMEDRPLVNVVRLLVRQAVEARRVGDGVAARDLAARYTEMLAMEDKRDGR
jgi:hypothetical protein